MSEEENAKQREISMQIAKEKLKKFKLSLDTNTATASVESTQDSGLTSPAIASPRPVATHKVQLDPLLESKTVDLLMTQKDELKSENIKLFKHNTDLIEYQGIQESKIVGLTERLMHLQSEHDQLQNYSQSFNAEHERLNEVWLIIFIYI